MAHNYIRQVNGLKLADIMFLLLCICAHGEKSLVTTSLVFTVKM